MTEATYQALKKVMRKNQEEWMAKGAPSTFLLEGFFSAFAILIANNDVVDLSLEFARELLKDNENLLAAYVREGVDGASDSTGKMHKALMKHINRLEGNCVVIKAQPAPNPLGEKP